MVDRQEVIELFKRYGFEHRKIFSGPGFETFSYRTGIFYNAELVGMKGWGEVENGAKEKAINNLEASGMSAKFKTYGSILEVEQRLFVGFFGIEDWKNRVQMQYNQHCNRCLSSFPEGDLEYQYIEGDYSKNGSIQEESLVDVVYSSLAEPGPILTIIEAPAGFGKTCSSYEIIRKITVQAGEKAIPFFAEFSRDRQARIFSHILMREVDQSFSSVNSEVVIQEIRSGRIVVVLDGFDELLQEDRSAGESDNQFETVEPMLDTISELLSGNAKVILTSRRSAIFDGEAFDEWRSQYDERFSVDRYRLYKPRINQWLKGERLETLRRIGIDLESLANPVLLGYLRFSSDELFSRLTEAPELIVETYFKTMMEREMDRQDLLINSDGQTEVLTSIASDMCKKNYVSDSKENIVDLILKTSAERLTKARTQYPPASRPTVERLAATFSNHAFLDRCDDSNDVRFVNEFVFGNFIACCALTKKDWVAHDERFVEPAVLSFIARTSQKREELWSSLHSMAEFISKSDRARFEFSLTRKLDGGSYSNETIHSVKFSKATLFSSSPVKNTVFTECVFEEINFAANSFSDITFINCEFWRCQIENDKSVEEFSFFNCRGDSEFISAEPESSTDCSTVEVESITKIERYILSRFFDTGAMSASRRHMFIGSLLRTNDYTRKDLEKGIRALKRRGFLEPAKKHNFVAMNKDSIGTIKDLLHHEGQ